MRRLLVILVACALFVPHFARAENVDLAISASNIRFSTSEFYAGETIRIYATVRNVGDVDTTAYVLFSLSSMLIGRSQVVSLIADGAPDEVFVDFIVPEGSFNIRAVIQGSSPQDTNPDNDSALTPLYRSISDRDRDGVEDDDDNCVDDENADQADLDHDGEGDVCDTDDDGDGVSDGQDDYPTDGSKTVQEVNVPPSAPVVTSTPPVTRSETTAVGTTEVATSVSSETDEQRGAENETEETPSESPRVTIARSLLTTSPLARFTYRQIDWRTYEFVLADQPVDGAQFSWDFGDGASSVQPKITHAFSGPGMYSVSVVLMNADGTSVSDVAVIDVSFFHLDNPVLQITLGFLFILLAALAVVAVKLRNRERV